MEDIELIVYWKTLSKYRKVIAAVTAAALVLSVAVSFLLPKKYEATASVAPPQQDDSLVSALSASLPTGLGGIAGGLLGKQSVSDLWVGILRSHNVRDPIIKKFGLQEYYDESNLVDTFKSLSKHVSVDESTEGIVSVTVEDWDPVRAAEMANSFITELDRVNRTMVTTAGARTRAFIAKRLAETKSELARLEGEMKEFQVRHKAIKVDDQSRVIIETIGEVKGQLMAKEVALETLSSYATSENPLVGVLKTEVDGLRRRLDELSAGRVGKDIFIPTEKIPDIALNYARLLRDVKIQETLFTLLTQQYEMARIQEGKDSPTVQVLDTATPPDKKSKPKRGMIVAVSTLSGLLGSVIYAFLRESTAAGGQR